MYGTPLKLIMGANSLKILSGDTLDNIKLKDMSYVPATGQVKVPVEAFHALGV
jgi:hypothetical protein